MILSDKQKEYIKNAHHRYNLKIGARRCGKTYLDILYLIPKRIIERKGKDGLNVILGVSKGTIERNVLKPLREIYSSDLISTINSQNIAILFGEEVYCLGAEKVNQVSKIQGSSIKWCYCDELAKFNEEVFEMLKASLDKPYSCLDGALNPENNNHWLKKNFLDKIEKEKLDVYVQYYTIFDNPFLTKEFVDNLCKEYKGTVYYKRLILGQWCNAEGLIYRKFADNPKRYIWNKKDEKGNYIFPDGQIIIGIDYGGTKSAQAFVAVLISNDYRTVIALASERIQDELDSKELEDAQVEFIKKIIYKYGKVDFVYPDNEESVHIRSLSNRCENDGLDVIVRGAKKIEINDRIKGLNRMLAFGIFYYVEEDCDTLVEAIESALWNDQKKTMKDERLDDGTSDIDTMDAFEYTFERDLKQITDVIGDDLNV